MSQLFRPRSNTIVRMGLLGVGLVLALLVAILLTLDRSPYAQGVGVAVPQPVLFSHALHVGQLELDCRYCHTSVDDSTYAGIPSTHTCMTCHSQVASNSPLLEPVRYSYENDAPLVWNRVHTLSESVYFPHAIHVQKGVGCETCHGRVDQMPLVWQTESMTMEWCLECHRDVEPSIRPADEVFTMGWEPTTGQQVELRRELMEFDDRADNVLTDCSTCHH